MLDLTTAFCMIMLGEQYEQPNIDHYEINFLSQSLTFLYLFQVVRYAWQGNKIGFLLFLILIPLTIAQSRYHYSLYREERKASKER